MLKRGVGLFLVIAIGATFALEFVFYALGFIPSANDIDTRSLILFCAFMCIPGVAALVASSADADPSSTSMQILPIQKNAVLLAIVLSLAVGVLPYAIASVLGLAKFDGELSTLKRVVPEIAMRPPAYIGVTGILLSVVLGLTVCALPALVSELGWRGYLQQRLQPLGRTTAAFVTGIVQGIWWLPLALGGYLGAGAPAVQAIGVMATSIAMAFVLGEIHRLTRSIGVCALAMGLFFIQCMPDSMWNFFFPGADTFLVAPFGIMSSALWLLLALALSFVPSRMTTESV